MSGKGYVTNHWGHLAGTYDGATVKLYIDGSLANSMSFSGTNAGMDTTMGAIGQSGLNDRYFQGKIDDVRVYNRALSAGEVKQLYNMGR